MDEITITEIQRADEDLLQALGALRIRAWTTEVPEIARNKVWLDPFDEVAMHWVARRGGVLVALARMSVHHSIEELPDIEECRHIFESSPPPAPIASINRLVVASEARRCGLSRSLDQLRIAAARRLGCRGIVGTTSSGEHRIRQLIEQGFEVIGDRSRARIEAVGLIPRPGKVLLMRI